MNPHLTEIAYVLDRSGSMDTMQEPAVAAFNAFIKGQLDVPGDARLTLVQFDDQYEVPVTACLIQDVPQLTAATYIPRGSTALLDAIGRTITEIDRRLQQPLPENAKPGKVIIAIFTDGLENASSQYTSKHIADLIRLYRDEKGWEFLFLAANQDAIATAAAMKMDRSSSSGVDFCKTGVTSTGTAISRKVRAIRMKTSGQMDAQAIADDAKPMQQIIQEEKQNLDDQQP